MHTHGMRIIQETQLTAVDFYFLRNVGVRPNLHRFVFQHFDVICCSCRVPTEARFSWLLHSISWCFKRIIIFISRWTVDVAYRVYVWYIVYNHPIAAPCTARQVLPVVALLFMPGIHTSLKDPVLDFYRKWYPENSVPTVRWPLAKPGDHLLQIYLRTYISNSIQFFRSRTGLHNECEYTMWPTCRANISTVPWSWTRSPRHTF